MADNDEGVRARLDRLTAQASADRGKWPELREYMREVLHCANPHPEAREWLEARLAEFARSDLVKVVKIAYEDEDAENKRAAGMVVVRNAERMPDARIREDHLRAVSQDTRLHPDAMAEAERLLRMGRELEDVRSAGRMHNRIAREDELKAIARNPVYSREARLMAGRLLLEDIKGLTDAYKAARIMMDDEGLPRETRLEAAAMLVDYCKATQRGLGMLGEIVASGIWPEVAGDAGAWLVDFHIKSRDIGMAKRIADAPETPQSVKDYAAKRFAEMGFRPFSGNGGRRTMSGMPAFMAERIRERIEGAKGVPPSPEQVSGRKTALKGPVK